MPHLLIISTTKCYELRKKTIDNIHKIFKLNGISAEYRWIQPVTTNKLKCFREYSRAISLNNEWFFNKFCCCYFLLFIIHIHVRDIFNIFVFYFIQPNSLEYKVFFCFSCVHYLYPHIFQFIFHYSDLWMWSWWIAFLLNKTRTKINKWMNIRSLETKQ